MNLILGNTYLGNTSEQGILGIDNSGSNDVNKINEEIIKDDRLTKINILITKDGKVQILPPEQPKELNYRSVKHTTIPIHLHEKGQDTDCSIKHLNYNNFESEETDIDRNAFLTTPLHSIRSVTSDLPASPTISLQSQQYEGEDINHGQINQKSFLKDDHQLQTSSSADATKIKNEEKLDHCTTGGASKIISPIEVSLQLGRVRTAETEDLNESTQHKIMLHDIKSSNNGLIKEEKVVKVHKTDSQMQTDLSPMLVFKEGIYDYDGENITDEGKIPRNIETTSDNNTVTNNNITSVIEGKLFSSTAIQTDETSLSDSTCQTDSNDQPTNNSTEYQQGREETCHTDTAATAVSKSPVATQTVDLEVVQKAVQTNEEDQIEGEFTLTIKDNGNVVDNEEGAIRRQESFENNGFYEYRRSETQLVTRSKKCKSSFDRTRTASPIQSRCTASDREYSPPVQDNVVARVLLEHVGSACPPSDPRRSVNYLDLSRLGEEGETPASDEIWLAVEGNGNGDEDKFLSSDDDTNTYSIATDKISTAATLAGHVSAAGQDQIDQSSHADLLDDELGVLGRSSFDEEVEATTRIQTVLAGELIPLKHILDKARENIVDVNHKVDNMEGMLSTLNGTVTQLSSRVDPTYAQNNQDQSGENRPMSRVSNLAMSGQEITLLDQLVTRIESLSTNVTNVESTRQLKEDNLLLKKDLQQYRDRELHLLNRMEALERRLNEVQIGGGIPPTQFVQTTELIGKPNAGRVSKSPRPKSRKDSDSSAEPVELPPIQVSDTNGKKPPSRSSSRKSRNRSGSKQSDSSSEGEAKLSNGKQDGSNGPPQKASLIPPNKTKKPSFIKTKTNGGSSSSDDNNGMPRERPPRAITPIDIAGKGRPMTPEAAADFLQSEIQITRSDNNILRQDIQVFRERESQLTMRNSNLENKLIEQSDAILALKGVGSKRETPIGDELLTESRVGQMNLNVNFEDDESVDEREEKKVIEEKAKVSKKQNGKRAPSEDRKSSVEDKSGSKSSTASSKRGTSKGSSNRSSSRDTKKSSAESSGEETKKAPTNTANGVPKTKPNGKLAKGSKSTAKQSQEAKTSEEDTSKVEKIEASESAKTQNGVKKKTGKGSFDGEQFKVTVQSEHKLIAEPEGDGRTMVITPNPDDDDTGLDDSAAKAEEDLQKTNEDTKKERKKTKSSTKNKDPRYCPIPKPPQFPAARPPREYVPVKQVPNSSSGVASSVPQKYADIAGPRSRRISGGNGNGYSNLNVPPTRSGRNSAVSDQGDVIQMLIKQESRDSNVDAAPPICQVSYDSIYDDPYHYPFS